MPGWPGWLACLAWLGWLGWIGWNDCLKSHTLDALEEVGGFFKVQLRAWSKLANTQSD